MHSSAPATPAKHNEQLLRVITWGICKHPGYQYVGFPRCCLSVNTKPRGKVSRENYEPCPQSLHGRSLYYGQTGSHVAQLWNCCLQPELPFNVLLTLFPRLCPSVHSTQSCIRCSRPCKQHLCTARQRVCQEKCRLHGTWTQERKKAKPSQ